MVHHGQKVTQHGPAWSEGHPGWSSMTTGSPSVTTVTTRSPTVVHRDLKVTQCGPPWPQGHPAWTSMTSRSPNGTTTAQGSSHPRPGSSSTSTTRPRDPPPLPPELWHLWGGVLHFGAKKWEFGYGGGGTPLPVPGWGLNWIFMVPLGEHGGEGPTPSPRRLFALYPSPLPLICRKQCIISQMCQITLPTLCHRCSRIRASVTEGVGRRMEEADGHGSLRSSILTKEMPAECSLSHR